MEKIDIENFEKQTSLSVLESLQDFKTVQEDYPEICNNIYYMRAIARLCLLKDYNGSYMLSKYDKK